MEALPLISVVVTGYRRPAELKQTIESLLSVVQYEPLEIVLADDGSPEEMREQMRALPIDRFVFSERNRGLGANANAGLAAARGKYVLQLQDDWLCIGPDDFLLRGIRLLQSRPSVGIIRFTEFHSFIPYERLESDDRVRIFHPERNSGFFLYSDHPHLKSRAFIDFIGPYKESRYMQKTELDMRDRFNAQTRFEAAFIEGCAAFRHIGEKVSYRRMLPAARIGAFMDRLPVLRSLARAIRAIMRAARPAQ